MLNMSDTTKGKSLTKSTFFKCVNKKLTVYKQTVLIAFVHNVVEVIMTNYMMYKCHHYTFC